MEITGLNKILESSSTCVFLNSILMVTDAEVEEYFTDEVTFRAGGYYGTIVKKSQSSKTFYEVRHKNSVVFILTPNEFEVVKPIYIEDYSEYIKHYEYLRYIKEHKSQNMKPYMLDLLEKTMQHYRKLMSNEEVLQKMQESLGLMPCMLRLPEADKLVHKVDGKVEVITYYRN